MEGEYKDPQQAVREYALFLKPLIGEAELARQLLAGLERVLEDPVKKAHDTTDPAKRPIDYKAIKEMNVSKNIKTHIINVFGIDEIKTYADLISYEKSGFRTRCSSGLGKLCKNAVRTHLRNEGYL